MKINLRSIDMNLLVVFSAIMQFRQLSAAGQELGMSQPAMSAALRRLRTTFNDELFYRKHEGMTPSPRALELYEQLQPVLKVVGEQVQQSADFDPALCKRQFSVSGGDYFDHQYLTGIVNDLMRDAPGICLSTVPLLTDEVEIVLHGGSVDMAIHYAQPKDRGIMHQHLVDDRLVAIARRDHPAITNTLSKRTYFASRHVLLTPPAGTQSHLAAHVGAVASQRKVACYVTQFSSMLPIVLASDCLATMPFTLASAYSQLLPVQLLELPLPASPLTIHLLWPAHSHHDLAHRWLRKLIASRLEVAQ